MTHYQKLIGISALIVSLTLAYYFLIYIPKQKDEDFERKTNILNGMIQIRTECLQRVHKAYLDNWMKACQSQGLPDDCSLSNSNLNEQLDKERNLCLKLYPSN